MSTITIAPLPTCRELFLALVRPPMQNDMLMKTWCRQGEFGIWFSRSAWSLHAIAELRMRMSNEKEITVWIPDYFCNESLGPLRELGTHLVFYKILDNLNPDLLWFRSNLNVNKPDLIVWVHFFGQPTKGTQLAKICQEIGAWLIEDATHVLRPISNVGEVGDIVMYSPHKHLAIPDGAILIIRENGPAHLGCNKAAIALLNNIASEIFSRTNGLTDPTIIWLIKRILQKIGFRGKSCKRPFFHAPTQGTTPIIKSQMSHLAKRLLSVQIGYLESIALIREQNWSMWDKNLFKNYKDYHLLKCFQNSSTPYLLCFIGKDRKLIENLHIRLQLADIPVLTWPDLPPEVLAESQLHSIAIRLKETRIFLPVHQTIKAYNINAHSLNVDQRD